MPATVIQGLFPHGLARITASAGPPAWVQQRIAMGRGGQAIPPVPTGRIAGPPPMQRMTPTGSAIELSPQLARFGNDAGQPLPASVRQKMESVFGTSFNDVRVHIGPHVAALGALAFTHGSHIHFAPGQYDPHTPHGQRALGHELAHVVQQRSNRVRNPFGSGIAVVHDANLEGEAERMAARAAAPAKPCCDACASGVAQPARASQNPFASNKAAKKKKATARHQVAAAEDQAKAFKACVENVKFAASFKTHIMEGEADGQSHTGYHSENEVEGMKFGACKMGDAAASGIYTGSCRKSGKQNFKDSTFFPKEWNIAKIREEVSNAFCSRTPAAAGSSMQWSGPSKTGGITIGGFDDGGTISTAFPVAG